MQYTKGTRRAALTVVAAIVAAAVGGLFSSNLAPASRASAADNPQSYKNLFLEKCSACHNAPDPTVTQYTQGQWRATVNRMLTKHGASDSIAPNEAAQIVEYLGLFPPKVDPNANGPLSIKAEDVWSTEPSKSLVFTFSSNDQLKAFTPQRGAWSVPAITATSPTTDTRPSLVQSLPTPNDSAILMETRDPVAGDLDLQTQFRFAPNAGAQTVGIVLSAVDARDYYVVRFDAAKSQIAIIQQSNGQFSIVDSAPTGDLMASPDGWHTLRVIYHNDTHNLTVWLDSNKKSVTKLLQWSDNEPFGLLTQGATTAGFRNLTVDMYSTNPATS